MPSGITGTAFDDNGNPVGGMWIYTWLTADSAETIPPMDPRVKAQTRSGADGRYTLSLPPQGGQYLLWAFRVLENRWISDNTVILDLAASETKAYDVTAQSGYYLRINQINPPGPFVKLRGGTVDFRVFWTHWNRRANTLGRGNMVIGIGATPGVAVRYPQAVVYPDRVEGDSFVSLNVPATPGDYTIYAYDSAASSSDQSMINYSDRFNNWTEHHIPIAKLTVE